MPPVATKLTQSPWFLKTPKVFQPPFLHQLRHTFASEALAAGISIFELGRVMGTSVKMIDRTYGHLVRDSEQAIRARLDARAEHSADEGRQEGRQQRTRRSTSPMS